MDLREQITQVRDGHEAGRERRVDREEGYLRDLKSTLGNKAKHNM